MNIDEHKKRSKFNGTVNKDDFSYFCENFIVLSYVFWKPAVNNTIDHVDITQTNRRFYLLQTLGLAADWVSICPPWRNLPYRSCQASRGVAGFFMPPLTM